MRSQARLERGYGQGSADEGVRSSAWEDQGSLSREGDTRALSTEKENEEREA